MTKVFIFFNVFKVYNIQRLLMMILNNVKSIKLNDITLGIDEINFYVKLIVW